MSAFPERAKVVIVGLGGIVGASLAPYIATTLATSYGIASVGYYLSIAGLLTALALFAIPAKPKAMIASG